MRCLVSLLSSWRWLVSSRLLKLQTSYFSIMVVVDHVIPTDVIFHSFHGRYMEKKNPHAKRHRARGSISATDLRCHPLLPRANTLSSSSVRLRWELIFHSRPHHCAALAKELHPHIVVLDPFRVRGSTHGTRSINGISS